MGRGSFGTYIEYHLVDCDVRHLKTQSIYIQRGYLIHRGVARTCRKLGWTASCCTKVSINSSPRTTHPWPHFDHRRKDISLRSPRHYYPPHSAITNAGESHEHEHESPTFPEVVHAPVLPPYPHGYGYGLWCGQWSLVATRARLKKGDARAQGAGVPIRASRVGFAHRWQIAIGPFGESDFDHKSLLSSEGRHDDKRAV